MYVINPYIHTPSEYFYSIIYITDPIHQGDIISFYGYKHSKEAD